MTKLTMIRWTPEERAAVITSAIELRRRDYRLSDLQLLKRAQAALPEERRRSFKAVSWVQERWFRPAVAEGLERTPAPAPAPKTPIHVTEAAPPSPVTDASTATTADPLAHLDNERLVAILLARVVADREADADVTSELMQEFARIDARLDGVIDALHQLRTLLGHLPGPKPPATPEPEVTVAEHQKSPAAPRKPKVAIVGVLPAQAEAIRLSLGKMIDVRTFLNTGQASAVGFGHYDAVIFSRHAGHAEYNKARETLGTTKVSRVRHTSAASIAAQAREILKLQGHTNGNPSS